MGSGLRAVIGNCLRVLAPRPVREYWRRRRIAAVRNRNQGKAVRDIFSEIYRDNRWGGAPGAFHSGSGSAAHHARLYAQAVREFIRDRGVRRVVDLGCGDFQVGAQLVTHDIDYTGVDIVEELVQHNQKVHGCDRLRFVACNIIDDPLPDGELCLIRQVFQHLSNDQVGRVLRHLRKFRYVLVTEHYPSPEAFAGANLDKPCGEDVRIYDGSAIYLDQPPFNQTVVGPLLDVDAGHCLVRPGERIRTFLIENVTGDATA
jgi:SAM-dependent methyltransferase